MITEDEYTPLLAPFSEEDVWKIKVMMRTYLLQKDAERFSDYCVFGINPSKMFQS